MPLWGFGKDSMPEPPGETNFRHRCPIFMERDRLKPGLEVFRTLVHHFFGRFFDKEALSPQGEAEEGPQPGLSE